MRQELKLMQHDLGSAKEVIARLLGHVGGPQALTRLAQGQSAESIVASLLGGEASASAEDTAATTPPTPVPLAMPLERGSSSSEPSATATTTATTTGQSILSMPPIGQLEMADLAPSWDWHDSNYQLESKEQFADAPPVQGLAAGSPRQAQQETGTGAERGPDEFLSAQQWSQGTAPAPGSWTLITDDIELVHHLLALFFCWEYPTFVTFSREHFIYDFRNGAHRYCSPILVNALLAMGCRFRASLSAAGFRTIPSLPGTFFSRNVSDSSRSNQASVHCL